MINPDSDERLSQLLLELGPADPPAELRRHVMARISLEGHRRSAGRIVPFTQGGIAMTRKAMWGLAAVAAVVLVVFAITGFPPVGKGTEGTIGAAKKYQAPQLSDKDVVLGDTAAQEFLQSEAFDRLIKDPEARGLLSNTAVKATLQDADLINAIRESDVRNALGNQALARLFDDADMRAVLEDEIRAKLSGAAVHQASAQAALADTAARAAVADALSNPLLAKALDSVAVRKAMDNTEFRKAMGQANVSAAMRNATFVRAIQYDGFANALRSARFESALSSR